MPEQICILCVAGFPHIPSPQCEDADGGAENTIKDAVSRAVGRPQKDGADMADAESTGRKRAAVILPDEIISVMRCEWALLKEAGGGVNPIKGCPGNQASDRHHGPDKNTLNNERIENLHAVCDWCHNRWHAANDDTYEGSRPKDDTPWLPVGDWKPHNSKDKMSLNEAMVEELKRGGKV